MWGLEIDNSEGLGFEDAAAAAVAGVPQLENSYVAVDDADEPWEAVDFVELKLQVHVLSLAHEVSGELQVHVLLESHESDDFEESYAVVQLQLHAAVVADTDAVDA